MKIAHLADIQVRFGSRHAEYRTVFNRLLADLEVVKPDRIVVAGDISHHKINMSPGSFNLISELLIGLSRIAPTDVILGNHDMNLQQLEQGDAISPIFNLATLIQTQDEKIAHIVTTDNKDSLDFNQKAVFYFPDSGFYKLNDKLVYGVYSMKDNKIISLEKREPGVNYIALFHGQIFGARGDNGRELHGDNLVKPSTFINFDIVMLGDIHEYQTFREDESMAYCGSLIQQNFGESVDKGYLLWGVESKTHERKYIPNDFGFAKITIAKGEKFEERIEHIKFSSNKKKTKISIVWEDYEENFSQEKENQIARLVKDRHGCEVVKVQFEALPKEIIVEEETKEALKESEQYLLEFIEGGSYNCSKEEIAEIIELHRETNVLCSLTEDKLVSSEWKLNRMEASNIFSLPLEPIVIDFDELGGITGIFGKNYNGKSNIIKAIVWGLFKEILGGGDSRYIVNLYTDSNKGFVKFWITIDDKKYYIERTVKTTKKKDGTTSNSYSVKYKTLEFEYDEDGNLDSEKWVNEKSDEATAEQNEVGKLVENAIGTFDDFTKTSLQTQGGKDDYLSMNQQPKNILINKYLGLEPYKIRYDNRNEFFKDIKKRQKELGDRLPIEEKIKSLAEEKNSKQKNYDACIVEKNTANQSKELVDIAVLELTRKLERLEPVSNPNSTTAKNTIDTCNSETVQKQTSVSELKNWLAVNFKKELPFDSNFTVEQLNTQLESERAQVSKEKTEYLSLEAWINSNPVKEEINIASFDKEIENLLETIILLEGQLQTFKGKKCPTCGTIHQKADPVKEEDCAEDIRMKKELLEFKRKKIRDNDEIKNHNIKCGNNAERFKNLKATLSNRKDRIDSLKEKIELFNKAADIIAHNNEVELKSRELEQAQNRIETLAGLKREAEETLKKIERNLERKKNNDIIQEQIDVKAELSRAYKITVFNMDNQATVLFGDIRVIESNIASLEQKLLDISDYEKKFRKYSIYLQAMHKDGIPALIIRRKLPIINHRINSILTQAVDFRIDLNILENGDIVETFYFNDDKSDSLPLSFASGSQKFVSLISIKDSLHHVSSLTKPSLSIIDEGFGTLDDELTFEIMNILNYLKNKHKNVIVITHRSEIKDFADNIIEVTKVRTGLTQEMLDKNPKAGITTISIA